METVLLFHLILISRKITSMWRKHLTCTDRYRDWLNLSIVTQLVSSQCQARGLESDVKIPEDILLRTIWPKQAQLSVVTYIKRARQTASLLKYKCKV